ncbi:MAG TPA: DUF1269 domain-containing protein [Streptosporangiaceae bacterium]
MTVTAWRFAGTEGADQAVLRLKRLHSQELIDVQDVAVVRWPEYASAPTAQEHLTAEGSKVTSMMNKLTKGAIDRSMIESVKGDLSPGSSALVLRSSGAIVDTVAQEFAGEQMELIRSDLSVQEQDRVRAIFDHPAGQDGTNQHPGTPS